MSVPKVVEVYTDGSCLGNPGKGGWGVIFPSVNHVISGNAKSSTNNKMEMTAVIEALKYVKRSMPNSPIKLYTDSMYVKNGVEKWMDGWKKKGWVTAKKSEVLNKDLWLKIDVLLTGLNVSFIHVKAHAGNKWNEAVDTLARKEAMNA
tara:strand:+ start:80 stop:523 length:444 start_codon:yes stop_codon:yes gene_type:complete